MHTLSFVAVVVAVGILMYYSSSIKEVVSSSSGNGIRLFVGLWVLSFLPMMFASVGPSTVTVAGFSLLIRGISYLVLLYAFIQIGISTEGRDANALIGLAVLWIVCLILPRMIQIIPYEFKKNISPIIFYIQYTCKILGSFGLLWIALICKRVTLAKMEANAKSPNKAL